MTDPLFTRASVTCPHCAEQHEVGLVVGENRAVVLNPVEGETMDDLLSEYMGERMKAKVREGFGA